VSAQRFFVYPHAQLRVLVVSAHDGAISPSCEQEKFCEYVRLFPIHICGTDTGLDITVVEVLPDIVAVLYV
jgi:hypothetical protein